MIGRGRTLGFVAAALATTWALSPWSDGWRGRPDAIAGDEELNSALEARALQVSETLESDERLEEARRAWRKRELELLERIDQLERELERQSELREAREREWLEFTKALAVLPVPIPAAPAFLPDEEPAVQEGPDPALLAAAEKRSQEMLHALRALLTAEQVLALDPLAVGHVAGGATGPLVVRLIDDLGRPSGVLMADRLRLECSRAARSVTLVFENGYESHGGVAVPFGTPAEPGAERGGVRRIHLPMIDPVPWLEALPELFDPEQREVLHDDGLWDLVAVRATLNELLRRSSTDGYWRLRGLGGVVRGVLRDVQLVEADADGRTVRRLFADALTIDPHGEGVVLTLTGGTQMRGAQSAPFLEGRYRVILPRASVEDWKSADLPGLAPAPAERPGG